MCKLVIEYHSKNIEKPRFHIFCCSLDTTLLSDRNSLNMYQYVTLGDYNSKVFSRVSFILLSLELAPCAIARDDGWWTYFCIRVYEFSILYMSKRHHILTIRSWWTWHSIASSPDEIIYIQLQDWEMVLNPWQSIQQLFNFMFTLISELLRYS